MTLGNDAELSLHHDQGDRVSESERAHGRALLVAALADLLAEEEAETEAEK